jgi:uncharacterized protein YdeI (YjbR/CyaY-like superfamily)
MGSKDPRVDAYIHRAAPFAQPILERLRTAVHQGCPNAEETIKWSMPFFMHGDRILANMAAFKQHCTFGFWHGRDAADRGKDNEAMGQFGRITATSDLPPARELKTLVQAAVKRIDEAGGAPRPTQAAKAPPKPALLMPADLEAALAAEAAARKTYEGFPPGKQREYLEWVIEAKRPETRAKRIAQAVEWLAEGKSRHWKHQDC